MHDRANFPFKGPVLRTWFLSLDKYLGPSTTLAVVLKKLLLDQLAFSPLLIGSLLSLFALSQVLSISHVKEKLRGVSAIYIIISFTQLP